MSAVVSTAQRAIRQGVDYMAKKILIVDDEVHIKMLLEQTLEELEDEFEVVLYTASDGEEGL